MLIFRAEYLDEHEEFDGAFFEFRSENWFEAVKTAYGKCYKNAHDNIKSMELVGKTVEQTVYF